MSEIYQKIHKLYKEDRLFVAHELYKEKGGRSGMGELSKEQHEFLDTLERERKEAELILGEMTSQSGWELHHNDENLKVYYSEEKAHFSLFQANNQKHGNRYAIKVVDVLDVPIKDVLAIFYEIDLYHKWVPRCSEAKLLIHPSPYRVLSYYKWNLFWPISDRDLLSIGYGIDRLEENGTILVVIRSIHSDEASKMLPDSSTIPKIDKKAKHGSVVRLHCHYAGFEIKALSKTKTQVTVLSNIDPRLSLIPKWIQNMATKYSCPYLMKRIDHLATNLPKEYQDKMKEKKETYDDIQRRIDKMFEKSEKQEETEETNHKIEK